MVVRHYPLLQRSTTLVQHSTTTIIINKASIAHCTFHTPPTPLRPYIKYDYKHRSEHIWVYLDSRLGRKGSRRNVSGLIGQHPLLRSTQPVVHATSVAVQRSLLRCPLTVMAVPEMQNGIYMRDQTAVLMFPDNSLPLSPYRPLVNTPIKSRAIHRESRSASTLHTQPLSSRLPKRALHALTFARSARETKAD